MIASPIVKVNKCIIMWLFIRSVMQYTQVEFQNDWNGFSADVVVLSVGRL